MSPFVSRRRRSASPGQVVVAADAWTAPLIEPLGTSLPLVVTREQVTYYGTDAPRCSSRPTSRCGSGWMIHRSMASRRSAVPESRSPRIAAAHRLIPTPAASTRTRRSWRAPTRSPRWRSDGLLGPALSTTTCLYTLPPDRDFVVDALPGHPNIHVALGAGHGYKFVAWFGKTLAALAVGPRSRLRPHPVRTRPTGIDRPSVGSRTGWSDEAEPALSLWYRTDTLFVMPMTPQEVAAEEISMQETVRSAARGIDAAGEHRERVAAAAIFILDAHAEAIECLGH